MRMYGFLAIQANADVRDVDGRTDSAFGPNLYFPLDPRLRRSATEAMRADNFQAGDGAVRTTVAEIPGYPTSMLLFGGPVTLTNAVTAEPLLLTFKLPNVVVISLIPEDGACWRSRAWWGGAARRRPQPGHAKTADVRWRDR